MFATLTYFYCFFRLLTGCYEVIEPCIKVCHDIFRTFCNDFFCSEELKIDNQFECTRLCYEEFRNAKIESTLRRPAKKILPGPLRMGNNTEEYYYEYDTEESPKALNDAYYQYLKSKALVYLTTGVGQAEDFFTDKMDEDLFQHWRYAPGGRSGFKNFEDFIKPMSSSMPKKDHPV